MLIETDVLVVGGGPVGLTAATVLAHQGVDAVTVTKHMTTAPTPRAHFISQRTMEVFRALGFEDAVTASATSMQSLPNVVWALSFSGPELARLRAWGTGPDRRDEYDAASPCGLWNIPQDQLEPVLLTAAQNAGADVRFGAEVIALEQDDQHVHATVRDRPSGEQWHIRARYVIGADGARSTVAQYGEFGIERDTGVMNWAVNVWLEADLTRFCAHRPGALYWMHQPGSGMHSSSAWICTRPWTEWVMALVYPPSRTEPVLDEDTALAHAHRMIDDPHVEVTVKAVSPWSVAAGLAGSYRDGRILLAGDSAHRNPPPNGLGINTGVGDVRNLCWKLGLVLSGAAGDALLDSYEPERQPVARRVVDRALTSLAEMDTLLTAFGLSDDHDEEQGWNRLAELAGAGDVPAQRRRSLDAALRRQHGQFNAHGVEFGCRYTSAAVLPDGEDPPEQPQDADLYYASTTFPGSPLPHAWVERGGERSSTIDLVAETGLTVVTGVSGHDWQRAAQAVCSATGVPVTTVTIDYQGQYHDVYGDWARRREVGEEGCLLVRPDRHVAWRCAGPSADARGDLTRAVRTLLARA